MSQHHPGWLISLTVGLIPIGFCGGMIGVWAIRKQGNRTTEIAERLDARLHRPYATRDRELQDMKEMLGGQ